MDEKLCTKLLKIHIHSMDDEKYLVKSMEDFVGNYEDFLQAVYPCTERLNPSLAKKCLKDVFGAVEGIELFGQRLAEALSWVRNKAKSATTGAKLSPPVRNIIGSIRKEKSVVSKPSVAKEEPRSSSSSSSKQQSELILPTSGSKKPRIQKADTKADIYRLYGVTLPQSSLQEIVVQSSQEIFSSQEAAAQQPPAPMQEESDDDMMGNSEDQSDKAEQGKALKPRMAAAGSTEWVDSTKEPMVMVRVHSSGTREESPLEKGEGGFCQARFGDEVVQTEVPNLMLEPLPVVFKKPAKKQKHSEGIVSSSDEPPQEAGEDLGEHSADQQGDEECEFREEQQANEQVEEGAKSPPVAVQSLEEEEDNKEKPLDAKLPVDRKYIKMWYKNSQTWGIRRAFYNKAQVFSLGGKSCGLSKETLMNIVNDSIKRMEIDNVSEEAARDWGREQIRQQRV